MNSFRVIDSHTGGEPTRLIVDGGPDLGSGSLAQRRDRLRDANDGFRRALCGEPRGSDVMVGGLVCEPGDATCQAGVIFFNNAGYLGMCGHGTIGLVATLRHLGRLNPGSLRVDTPVGPVLATLHDDGRVSIRNVRAFRSQKDVEVDVPGVGRVVGDVAWGGNWFFLVKGDTPNLTLAHVGELSQRSWAIMDALEAAGITGEDGGKIDHVELFAPPPSDVDADSVNFVMCPGGAWDRSPCGTGTSAKAACLAADGKLAPGHVYRQASVLGSIFEVSYEPHDAGGVVPTITGRAFVNGDSTILLDPDDPFAFGVDSSNRPR